MKTDAVSLSVHLPPAARFLPLATSFAEESAAAFGLKPAEALKLTLACEEIFLFLGRAGIDKEAITIEAKDGGYYIQLTFLFSAAEINLRAFNLTAVVSADDSESLEEMGLLIASRSVERFSIAHNLHHGMELALIKEKTYPEATGIQIPAVKPLESFRIATPDPEGLKLFVRLAAAHYPPHLCPHSFSFPGKVVDMAASGEYSAATATDGKGQTGGGIFWRRMGSRTVEFFGPFLFNQRADSGQAEALVDACIGEIAKTDALCLINRHPTPELPLGYFESLGDVDLVQPDGRVIVLPVYYRQLREDPGCQVWAHPALEPFLKEEYRRLVMPREIRTTVHEGEQRPPCSVFAPQFDRLNHRITLRAIWDGVDAARNLARHVKTLKADNLPNIFFEIDLGSAWQAGMTVPLLEQGFTPRLVLPYGGVGDVVVFQYKGES